MNFIEYMSEASRTDAPLENRAEHDKHMLLGMITETGELGDIYKKNLAYKRDIDVVNAKEEIGDFCWYLANLCADHQIYPSVEITPYNEETGLSNIEYVFLLTRGIVDLERVLSFTLYEFNLVVWCVENLLRYIYSICKENEFNISSILDTNIEKLKARYPEKFDEDKAQNRDLKKERMILEK